MAIEREHESLPAPTPETNRFLENLQKDASEIAKVRLDISPRRLGVLVKEKLAVRAREFAGFGYFDHIQETDFDAPYSSGEEDSGRLGLFVHIENSSIHGYAERGVLLTPDGILLKGIARDYMGSIDSVPFSFDFEGAKKVPPEDYPKYFDEAVEAMKYATNKKTGVHADEFRKEQAERLAARIKEIEDDNRKYGVEGAEFTSLYPQTIEKANEFMQRIARLRGMVAGEHRGITREQLENVLGHVFAAEEYQDSDNHTKDTNFDLLNGAEELIFMAGILVAQKDAWIGEELYLLATDMWSGAPSQSSDLVRRANRVPYRNNPENERVYEAMVMYKIGRHHEGEVLLDVPEFKQPPSEVVTKNYGVVSSAEITDWLLNQSVADPL